MKKNVISFSLYGDSPKRQPGMSSADYDMAVIRARAPKPEQLRDVDALTGGRMPPQWKGNRLAAEAICEARAGDAARARALMAEGVTTLEIKSGYGLDRDTECRMLRTARELAQWRPVDVVTTSEVSVSVTVDSRQNLDAIVAALSEFSQVTLEHDMALLCAVGDRLRNEPEIAARAVGVLEEVPLRMISQAASRRNITVILRQSDLTHAMQRLHEEFFE